MVGIKVKNNKPGPLSEIPVEASMSIFSVSNAQISCGV